MRLTGKTAIITGASSGIGKSAALRFAQEGAHVVMGARREAELGAVAEQIRASGGRASFLAGDICDGSYLEALTHLALEETDQLDIAFNNAGTVGTGGQLETIPEEEWRFVLKQSDKCVPCCAASGPRHESARCRIAYLHLHLVGHTIGLPGMGAYAASKAGLLGLVQVLAVNSARTASA